MHVNADLTTIRGLEERAFNAWPALQTVLVDGWVFRWADGYTKRANSANALASTGSFSQILKAAEQFYAQHGLPTVFRLSPLAGEVPDALLENAGYQHGDETIVLVTNLTPYEGAVSNFLAVDVSEMVDIAPVPDSIWCNGFAEANNIPATRRVIHDRMLAALRFPAAFAVLRIGTTPVAYGRAVIERGMVGLFDIVTAPAMRRRGYGRQLVSALLAWGLVQGAYGAYLQVVATNIQALALYEQLGFREEYRYHYRIG